MQIAGHLAFYCALISSGCGKKHVNGHSDKYAYKKLAESFSVSHTIQTGRFILFRPV